MERDMNIFREPHSQLDTSNPFTKMLNPMNDDHTIDGIDLDYHMEVANAGFGDMLHDSERNQKYYAALRKTIAQMHAAGREAHVLDIGTGTGLLSMMAVKAGADSVTACECFPPMANCAERIFAANGVADRVRLVKKRSDEIKVGIDMPRRANLLVAELLDTELIGEHALTIYNHAHDELLTEDAICIPSRARCYGQVAQSRLASDWNTLKPLANLDGELLLDTPQDIKDCPGRAHQHDVQVSQLPPDCFTILTEPAVVFEFDFTSKQKRKLTESRDLTLKAKRIGHAEMIFYWWDIDMDAEGEIPLSCAPYWAHPDLSKLAGNASDKLPLPNVVPWRDHWMQALYYIPKAVFLKDVGTEFVLQCNHDDCSLWFDAHLPWETRERKSYRHFCECSLHLFYSRSRIGQLNQSTRNKRFLRYLENTIVKDESHVLALGDCCMLGAATARLGAASVRLLEPEKVSYEIMETVVRDNDLKQVEILTTLLHLTDREMERLTHVFADPSFMYSLMPWDSFYFGTLVSQIRKYLSPSVKISPHSARVFAVPVEFLDLHKIRIPIGTCEGFDLSLFDEMIESSLKVLLPIDTKSLWEYPGRALAQPQEVLSVDFRSYGKDKDNKGIINIEESGSCNAIALWVDWQLDDTGSEQSNVSTGPTEPIYPGAFIKWDMFVSQGVHIFEVPMTVEKSSSVVEWDLRFRPKMGGLGMRFEVKPNVCRP